MTKDEALKLALETLEYAGPSWIDARQPAITAIKEALAQSEPEYLAFMDTPQRTWVGLTDKEILADDVLRYHFGLNGGAGPVSKSGRKIVDALEAKLKEKNT